MLRRQRIGYKEILARIPGAMEAESERVEMARENQAAIEAVSRMPSARITLSVVPNSGLPVSLSAR